MWTFVTCWESHGIIFNTVCYFWEQTNTKWDLSNVTFFILSVLERWCSQKWDNAIKALITIWLGHLHNHPKMSQWDSWVRIWADGYEIRNSYLCHIFSHKPQEWTDHGEGGITGSSNGSCFFVFPPQVQHVYSNYFHEYNPHMTQECRINLPNFTLDMH